MSEHRFPPEFRPAGFRPARLGRPRAFALGLAVCTTALGAAGGFGQTAPDERRAAVVSAASPAPAAQSRAAAAQPDPAPAAQPSQPRKVTAQQLLELAERQIGVREDHTGGGTKFQQWYVSSPRARQTAARDGGTVQDYADAPWCDMFVSWVGEQLGIRETVGWDAWTVKHAEWFRANGRWGTEPTPGAVVFFDWSGGKSISGIDHVGFVVRDNGDGTITTIEGNADGVVAKLTRSVSTVAGYGYPEYAD